MDTITETNILQEKITSKDTGNIELKYFEDLEGHAQEIILDLLASIFKNNVNK